MYPHFGSLTSVTPFGLLFLAAIVTAWWLARRNAVSVNIDGSHVDLIIPVTIIVGVAGGVLLSLIMPMDRMIAGELMQTGVRVRLFGMLGTAALAVFVYSRILNLPFRRLLDIFALPTVAGLAIHRLGCFLAGCCWGDLVGDERAVRVVSQVQTLPFLRGFSSGVQYPPGSLPYEQHLALGLIEPGASASLPLYPVQLYEGAVLFVLLLVLWRFPWRRSEHGLLTVLVICAYAVIRFFIEYLRADGALVLGNLTATQIQCLFLLASGALIPRLLGRDRKVRPV